VTEQDVAPPPDAGAATDRDSWLALIDAIGEEAGYFQTVGKHHWALFADEGTTLLVSFETIAGARARPGQMPLAHGIAETRGWSHLCLIAEDSAWFRDPAVYAYFDRLVDEAFFEDFDRVVFYGAGALAYAACAYSVAAPGARVLALNPVATLDPAIAGWDNRHRAARRLDFASRYGYAPDMVEGAAHVTILVDPAERLDAMHAALFHAPYVTTLRARWGGAALEAAMVRLGILSELVGRAADGTLTAGTFARLWRKRRSDMAWLQAIQHATARNPRREIMVCRNVVQRTRSARFRKRLNQLQAAASAAAEGQSASDR